MLEIISSIVTFMKGIDSLRQIGEFFVSQWIEYDVKQIGNEADSKKEENEVLALKLKQSSSDSERRVIMRLMYRNR